MKNSSLASLCIALATFGCRSTPSSQPAGGMEVVPLKWASAEQVAPKVLERERTAVQDPAQLRVMVDARTNSVLVVAAPQDMPNVLAAISALDVKTP